DPKRLLVSQPDSGEQALDIAEMLTRSGAIDLVIVDSVAALVPKAEIEGDMGEPHMGLQARLMSQALRKLTGVTGKTNTTIIFINQLRQKIGVVFGNPETTPGGNALKYYASVRLDVRRIGKISAGETAIGNRTRVKVVKNKVAPPFAEAEFDIRWGTGIDAGADLVEMALAAGVLEKSGVHVTFAGKSLGQGRDRARDTLLSSPDLMEAVRAATIDALPSQQRRVGAKAA
ncbi:MAG: DNA recombination/repair protein RecA, partial [Pseudomonadota bacterium]